jgi:hypothetical protein
MNSGWKGLSQYDDIDGNLPYPNNIINGVIKDIIRIITLIKNL